MNTFTMFYAHLSITDCNKYYVQTLCGVMGVITTWFLQKLAPQVVQSDLDGSSACTPPSCGPT